MYKLSVKDHLIEKFEKLFCDASAEPFRGNKGLLDNYCSLGSGMVLAAAESHQ